MKNKNRPTKTEKQLLREEMARLKGKKIDIDQLDRDLSKRFEQQEDDEMDRMLANTKRTLVEEKKHKKRCK